MTDNDSKGRSSKRSMLTFHLDGEQTKAKEEPPKVGNDMLNLHITPKSTSYVIGESPFAKMAVVETEESRKTAQ